MQACYTTLCPYNPQQNGVAGRKSFHLIETARFLLFRMSVPKLFWSDAIFTACYLINRMMSLVLNGKFPVSIIFPHAPTFPLPPCSTGHRGRQVRLMCILLHISWLLETLETLQQFML